MKKSIRTSLTILVVLLDEIILVAIVLFVLWKLGIHVPLGVVIALVVVLAAFSLILYKRIAPVLNKKQVTGGEGMLGLEGKVVTPLTPEGVIKVCGERWKAYSTGGSISADEEVVVVGLEGLKLFVRRKNSSEQGEGAGKNAKIVSTTGKN